MNTSAFSPLRPPAENPQIRPALTDGLRATIAQRTEAALACLNEAITDFGHQGEVVFANSLGAEDMVLTDLILRNKLPIGLFSLDTGRLPTETYDLIYTVEQHYATRLTLYFPDATDIENYVSTQGINAFYESVDLRKTCCSIRKVRPLMRALKGKRAWITGLRAAQSTTRTGLPERERDTSFGSALGDTPLEKINPLAAWSEQEIWAYIRIHNVPYNALHERFYPSIGCAPCTRAIAAGEDVRAGRWWWEDPTSKECGLHVKKG